MRKLLLLLALVMLAPPAPAQSLRTLPANAKRGTVGQQHPLPLVEINSTVLRLAPGGVIYDQNNRSIIHGALPPGAHVAFTVDMNGDIARIYLLTHAEREQLEQRK